MPNHMRVVSQAEGLEGQKPKRHPKRLTELPNFKAIPAEGWVYHYLKNFIDAARGPMQSSMAMHVFIGAAANNRRHGEESTLSSIIGVDNIDAFQETGFVKSSVPVPTCYGLRPSHAAEFKHNAGPPPKPILKSQT
jgi:hypothetical protein